MLQEYSIDPDGFKSVEQFQRIIEACGISEGRYIAILPNVPMRQWKDLVLENLRAIDPDRVNRARELMDNCIRHNGVLPSRESICGNWLKATLQQHKSEPFKAVVTEKEDFPNRTSLDDLSVDTDPWKAKRGDRIPIDAVSIGNAAAPLLRISKEILLVDAYFDPKKSRYQESLVEIVKRSILGKKLDRFECHCKVNFDQSKYPSLTVDAWSYRFEKDCKQKLPDLLPKEFSMTIFLWDEIPGKEIMHARYIMTELAALKFDHGLDSSKPDATTDIDWLTRDVHQSRWKDLELHSTPYKHVRKIEIIGQRNSSD